MVRLGDLSYSWYLWHWPAIVFTAVRAPDLNLSLVAGFGSIGIALLSYVFVEDRLRHNGDAFLYLDNDHVTVERSALLADNFIPALSTAIGS